MSEVRYYIVDAFSREAFSGAQIGVFPRGEQLTGTRMQQLAGELNLPQTIFLLPPQDPDHDYRARIFMPHREMNFAAQAIVAAGYVLAHLDDFPKEAPDTRIALETRRGVLPVHIIREHGELRLITLAMSVEPIVDSFTPPLEELAAILGLKPSQIETQRFHPKIAACGRPFLIIPLKDDETVRRAVFDFKTWAESTAPATAAQEMLLFSARTRRPEVDFHARLVGPDIAPREAPPVGAAMPAFCAYLCAHPHIRQGTYVFTVERGAEDSRRSLIHLEMDHRGTDRLNLRIGGEATIVAEGNIL
ncbi:MAG: PhzF family phenazine biosynthesis protein [Methylohalobius crimeensis]